MDGILEFLGDFGWREAVVLCIVMMTIYFVIMVLRFLQLPRPDAYRFNDLRAPEMRSPPPEFDAPPGSVLAGVWESPTEPSLDAPVKRRETVREVPRAQAETAAPSDFAVQLTQKSLEGEVRQLRDQLAESRDEISRLREEMGRLSAAQKVSPLYNEAMAMAVRGVDAAGVAGRCGISIAEAELVVALSKRPEPESHEEADGGEYGRNERI